jgi:hypothetical protein
MRLLLAFCLVLFCETSGFAENNSKAFVEECSDISVKGLRSYSMGQCFGVISTMMAVGPFLNEDMRFCPGNAPIIVGVGTMNQYTKAHPDLLKSDGPDGDRLYMLLSAFRERWPCK